MVWGGMKSSVVGRSGIVFVLRLNYMRKAEARGRSLFE
jgi:hypothetical protein